MSPVSFIFEQGVIETPVGALFCVVNGKFNDKGDC